MELVHIYGVLIKDKITGLWSVLDDEGHRPEGLSTVVRTTRPALQVNYETPLVQVGVCNVTMDETWSGTYTVGASVGLPDSILFIKSGGALVDPNSMPATGNIWFDLWGWIEGSI